MCGYVPKGVPGHQTGTEKGKGPLARGHFFRPLIRAENRLTVLRSATSGARSLPRRFFSNDEDMKIMRRNHSTPAAALLVVLGLALAPAPASAQFGGLLDMLIQPQQDQGGGSQGQKSPPRMTGDPLADALRQIDVSKEIAAKAEELQDRLRDVIYTIKLYQALNGGIWYELGRQMNEVYKLDAGADAWYVKKFIAATRSKREAGQNALKHVEINAVEDIEDQNHTIAANSGKIEVLRNSVTAYVKAAAGPGHFENLIADQNIPLDSLMNAYLLRLESIMASMEGAALVFDDMSLAYDQAVADMDAAINAFSEQSGLVGAEVVKQAAIITVQVLQVNQAMQNTNDTFQKVLILMQGTAILADLASVGNTLGAYRETFEWFDANAAAILAASRGARNELEKSVSTLAMIRPLLMASWRNKIRTVGEAAAELRNETVDFESQLAEMQRNAPGKGAEIMAADMAELDMLMKKPRRLKKN